MHIAMVTPHYPPTVNGGGELSCKLLVDNLVKYTDHTVEVVSGDHLFPNTSSISRLCAQMHQYLKQNKDCYDIIHTYNMAFLPSVGYLTKKYNINSVGTLNGRIYSISLSNLSFKYVNPKFYRNKALLHYINYIKKKTALSPYERDQWIKDGLSPKNFDVIVNMLDPMFTPDNGKKNEDGNLQILYVGNHASSHPEGMTLCLKAYERLLIRGYKASLVVVGKGWEDHLKKHAKGIPVNYLGWVPNEQMPQLYAESDILYQGKFLIPVPIERITVEAMASGVCVVTMGDEYYSPIIRHNKDGVLIPPSQFTVDTLENVFSNLAEQRNTLELLGRNAVSRVHTVCSPKTIVGEYEKIYRSF